MNYDRPTHTFPITDAKGQDIGRLTLPEPIVDIITELNPDVSFTYHLGPKGIIAFSLDYSLDQPAREALDVGFTPCPMHDPFDVECHACLLETVGHLMAVLRGESPDG